MNGVPNYQINLLKTSSECISSSVAYIFDSSLLGFSVSKSNLEQLINWVLKTPDKYIKANAVSLGALLLENNKRVLDYFDLIVFSSGNLDSISSINGYVQYFNPQKLTLSINEETGESTIIEKIYITLNKSGVSERNIINIDITNSIIDSSDTLDIGEKENQYFSQKNKTERESYIKYTSRLDQLKEDKSCVLLLGEMGISTGDLKGSRLSLINSTDIASFDKITMCIFNNDLSLLAFNTVTGEYSITSLSKKNIFGSSYEYISGFLNIPRSNYQYKDMSGTLVVYESESDYLIYCLDTGDIFRYNLQEGETSYFLKLDPWDLNECRAEYLSDSTLEDRLYLYSGLSFNKNQYSLVKVLGGWYYLTGIDNYIVGPHGVVLIDKSISNFENLIPYSESLFLYQSNEETYLLPIIHRYQRIYKEKTKIKLSNLTKLVPNTRSIASEPGEELDKLPTTISYREYSSDQKIIFDGMRKKPRRTKAMPKNIVASFRGILGYKENNLLYIL